MSIIDEAGDPEAIAKSLRKVTDLMETLGQALDALVEGVSFSAPDDVRQYLGLRASVVPYVDARLAVCGELLAEGLRGEALGRATETPPLIETAKLLDLGSHPNWPAWQQALTNEDMPEPARPRMDLVKALEKAQAELRKLKPLLDAWRRLNLANGGLTERIAVLRRLRSSDPVNADKVWKKALLEHEQQRLMQIEPLIKQATRDRDERQLQALVDEMAADWVEPVAPRLRKAASAALESFRGSRVDRELDELAVSLAAAHEARDLEATRELRHRWQPLADEKGATDPGDARLVAAEPALQWVQRHDRMEALAGEIWQSLDSKPGGLRAWREWVRSLDRMGAEMEDLAEKLPGEVDVEAIQRTRERIGRKRAELERHEKFRRRMMTIGAASTAILLAAGVVYYDMWSRYEKKVLAACEQLDQLLEECERGLGPTDPGLEPSLLKDVRVAGRSEKLKTCNAGLADRRQGFEDALAAATQAIQAAQDEGRDDPLAPWPGSFAEATKAVARIEGNALAKSGTERADVEKAKGAIDRLVKQWIAAADLHLDAQIQELDAELDTGRTMLVRDVAGGAAIAAAVQAKAESLAAVAATLAAPEAALGFAGRTVSSPAAVARFASDGPLGRKVAELQRMADERRKFSADLGRLPNMLGQWPAYGQLLEEITKTYGDLPQAREFEESAAQLPNWEAIAAWQAFAGGLGPLDRATPEQAKAVTKTFEAFPQAVRNLTMAKRFTADVLPGLDVLASRDPKALQEELRNFLRSNFMGEVAFLVEDDQGGVYYCLAPEPEIGKKFAYLTGAKDTNRVWPDKRSKHPAARVKPSPQARLAAKFAADLDKTGIAAGLALDDLLLGFIKQTVDDKETEPVVRLLSVIMYLRLANEFSRPIRDQGQALIADVDDQGVRILGGDMEGWASFLPPDRGTQPGYLTARSGAEELLKKVADEYQQLERAVDAERELLRKPTGEGVELVGLVSLAADGTPALVCQGDRPPEGPLWWMTPTGEFVEAGAASEDGGFRPAATPPPAGTPLWRMVAE